MYVRTNTSQQKVKAYTYVQTLPDKKVVLCTFVQISSGQKLEACIFVQTLPKEI
ncbi:MAG: hypothetical protein ABFS16_05850 [Bacteroidota bacterium]